MKRSLFRRIFFEEDQPVTTYRGIVEKWDTKVTGNFGTIFAFNVVGNQYSYTDTVIVNGKSIPSYILLDAKEWGTPKEVAKISDALTPDKTPVDVVSIVDPNIWGSLSPDEQQDILAHATRTALHTLLVDCLTTGKHIGTPYIQALFQCAPSGEPTPIKTQVSEMVETSALENVDLNLYVNGKLYKPIEELSCILDCGDAGKIKHYVFDIDMEA